MYTNQSFDQDAIVRQTGKQRKVIAVVNCSQTKVTSGIQIFFGYWPHVLTPAESFSNSNSHSNWDIGTYNMGPCWVKFPILKVCTKPMGAVDKKLQYKQRGYLPIQTNDFNLRYLGAPTEWVRPNNGRIYKSPLIIWLITLRIYHHSTILIFFIIIFFLPTHTPTCVSTE